MTEEIKVGEVRKTRNDRIFTTQVIYKDRCIIEFEDGQTASGVIPHILEWSKPHKKPFKSEVIRYVTNEELTVDDTCFVGADCGYWSRKQCSTFKTKVKITVEEIVE